MEGCSQEARPAAAAMTAKPGDKARGANLDKTLNKVPSWQQPAAGAKNACQGNTAVGLHPNAAIA